MLETLRRFLSPEYLVVAEPGAMGGLRVLYLALGLLFAAGLVLAVWVLLDARRRAQPPARRAWAWFELWVCLAGFGSVVGRFLGWPGWSARIWPYSLAALAAPGLAVLGLAAVRSGRARPPAWLLRQARILTLSPLPSDASQGTPRAAVASIPRVVPILLALAVHLVGIALVLVARYEWPYWLAPLVLLALMAPQAPLLFRRQPPELMTLTPLLGAYAVTALWAIYLALNITVRGWQGLAFPDPLTSLFYVDGIILAAVIYTLLCQLAISARRLGKPRLLWRWTVAGLLVATLTWAGTVYLGKRTHGTTASDPYAYAQMGVDLAERGTFLHRFALFQQVIPLEIAYAPVQPVGYHVPLNELGDCPSVWATGASVLLAAGYLLLGETGLYVTTPVVGLLALVATWALARETICKPDLRGFPKSRRPVVAITGAIAIALLATSPEHVDRLLVPMADATAMLFTVLTLLFALRGMHQLERNRAGLPQFALSGISFAWAYWTRHTQIVLALPVFLAIILGSRAQSNKRAGRRLATLILPLLAFSAAALIAALPDIIYRWRVFGGPFATETTELPLMGLQHIGPVAAQMLRDSLAAGEWGYLFPFAIYGGYLLARRQLHNSLVLGTAFAAVLLVHLTYHSLRLRDLISLFPLIDLAVAYGAVTLVQCARALLERRNAPIRLAAAFLAVAAVAWVILSLSLSRWAMIDNLWKPGWASFGYMRADNRAAFDRLAGLTEPDAIVGASLNAGAVMMLAGRDAIRPYDSWTEYEWGIFVSDMQARGRPIYLLDDGGLMAEFIEQEQSRRRLTPIAELRVPLFYTRNRETGWLYLLEEGP